MKEKKTIENFYTKRELSEYVYLRQFSVSNINGVYCFRYHRKGTYKSVSGKDVQILKQKGIELAVELSKNFGKIEKNKTILFNDYALKWLEIVKKPNMSREGYRVYKSVFDNHIKPFFDKKTFSEIDAFCINEYFNQFKDQKGKVRENSKIVLDGVFDYALCNGIIERNVMKVIKVKKHIRQKGKPLSRIELDNFLNSIKGTKRETAYKILLYSGCRPNELSTIEFNWQNNTMVIKNSKLKDSQKEYEKRIVPIFPKIKEIQNEIETNKWKYNSVYLTRVFREYCQNHHLYELRHTFVTFSKECDVNDELVSLWTGHELGKTMTAKVYTNYTIEYQQKEAEKIKF